MSIQPKEANEWIALIGRVVTPLGIVALIFLQTQFASKTEVKELKSQTQKLETAVTLLVEQQKRMDSYDRKLEVFSDRLRQLEVLIAKAKQ